MEQYIPKSAVLAEIKKRIERCAKQREDMLNVQCHSLADDASARMGELNCFQDFLDTLEVKKINFENTKSIFNGQYLSKDKVVTTIERLQDECEEQGDNNGVELLEKLFNKLDTFEIKEVDLDFTKDVDMWIEDNGDSNGFFNVQELAKHFYELGLKAQKGEKV